MPENLPSLTGEYLILNWFTLTYSSLLSLPPVRSFRSGLGNNSLAESTAIQWDFNEGTGGSANDSSGNNNTGTITGATWETTKAKCVSGYCLSFDGVNDSLACTGNSSLNSKAFTVDFWINPDQIAIKYLVSKQSSPGWRFFMSSTTLGKVELDAYPGEIANLQTDPSLVGKWKNVVGTYDGSSVVKIYDNGVLKNSATGIATMYNDNDGSVVVSASPYDGFIDEVRIYNAAMPLSQIQQNYYSGLNRLIASNAIDGLEYREKLAELKYNINELR